MCVCVMTESWIPPHSPPHVCLLEDGLDHAKGEGVEGLWAVEHKGAQMPLGLDKDLTL